MSRNEGKSATQAERSRARREQILDAAFHTFTPARLPRHGGRRDRRGRRHQQGRRLLPLPDQGGDLPRARCGRPPTGSPPRSSGRCAEQTDPIARADAALRTVLVTFAGHRTMARLLFVDAMGAGRVFNAETNALHDRFAAMIAGYLDEAVADGAIPPIDTALTGVAWFGALNEVVARWLLVDDPRAARDGLPDAPRAAAAQRRRRRGADRRAGRRSDP